jgi:hypothetical protein
MTGRRFASIFLHKNPADSTFDTDRTRQGFSTSSALRDRR